MVNNGQVVRWEKGYGVSEARRVVSGENIFYFNKRAFLLAKRIKFV